MARPSATLAQMRAPADYKKTHQIDLDRQDSGVAGWAAKLDLSRPSARELFVFDPLRNDGFYAEPPHLVFLVVLEIAFEPFDMAVAFEGEDVGGYAVKEPAVVADDHGAAGEIFKRLLERAQRVDVEIVGRLVEQQHVGSGFEHLSEMHAVTLAAGELPHFFLLIGALEIERRAIGARVHLALAELELIEPAGNLLPYCLLAVERIARLIDISKLNRIADVDRSRVRLVLRRDHAKQRRLARPVRADHADDPARRQFEGQIVDQQIAAEALCQILEVDHVLAETLGDRDDDLRGLGLFLAGFLEQFLVAFVTRLGLGLPRAWRSSDPFLLAGERALARFLFTAFLLQALLLLHKPGGVIALVGNTAAAIELENPAGDVVEKIAVVGHDQDGAWIVAQMAFEPHHRLGVQMVGRLVEQKQIRLLQKKPAKR